MDAQTITPTEAAGDASPRAAMRESPHKPFTRSPGAVSRPVFLNPLQVRLPVTATVSLAHRISGMLLVAWTPVVIGFLSHSLHDKAAFIEVLRALRSFPGRVALLVLVWCLAHHTAAGIRHLLFDAGIGTGYAVARRTAWMVHGIAALAVLLSLMAMAWLGSGR